MVILTITLDNDNDDDDDVDDDDDDNDDDRLLICFSFFIQEFFYPLTIVLWFMVFRI